MAHQAEPPPLGRLSWDPQVEVDAYSIKHLAGGGAFAYV